MRNARRRSYRQTLTPNALMPPPHQIQSKGAGKPHGNASVVK